MWVLGMVIMVDQIDQNVVRGVISQIQADFHVNDAQIGVLLSAFVLVNGLVTVPAGYLADRWNRSRTIGHTVVGWSFITMLTAAAQSFGMLVGMRALLGFGQAITEPSSASLLSDYYPTSRRGRVFSNQQVMVFIGFGLGIAIGGAIGSEWGWRAAFLVVGPPSIVVAFLAYTLKEPKRGAGDLMHVDATAANDAAEVEHVKLFERGFGQFVRDMARGLRDDFRTIWQITTLRYALVGISALMFTVAGIGAWLPQFHQRFSGMTEKQATSLVGALIIFGGIPGVLFGGHVADRFATRVKGARVAIPAYCIFVGTTFLILSYLPEPAAVSVFFQLLGIFAITSAIPALRAGMADAVPAHLRGAGFGAFNLVSILFGFGGDGTGTGLTGLLGGTGLLVFGLLYLAIIIPSIAVQVRRFHDQDKSGWMVLLGLIPYVGGIILLVFMLLEGTRGPNRFGPDPKDPDGDLQSVFS